MKIDKTSNEDSSNMFHIFVIEVITQTLFLYFYKEDT